jgi:8-hydroxy-5-deazaflavin:NADPH oxidoreductase
MHPVPTPCCVRCPPPRSSVLEGVQGIGDAPVMDATNVASGGRRTASSRSLRSSRRKRAGRSQRHSNANFTALYDRLGEAGTPPGMVHAADEEARAVTEQLIRDARYEPVSADGPENAGAVENFLDVIFAVAQAGTGRF